MSKPTQKFVLDVIEAAALKNGFEAVKGVRTETEGHHAGKTMVYLTISAVHEPDDGSRQDWKP
jgi:hypothetical protein